MNPPQCKDCRYWVYLGVNPPSGLCHRYPKPEEKGDIDWCGEFQMNSETYARFSKEHPMMIEGPNP